MTERDYLVITFDTMSAVEYEELYEIIKKQEDEGLKIIVLPWKATEVCRL